MCHITALDELVVNFLCSRPLSLKALLLDVAIDLVEFTNESNKLLLLLLVGGLADEGARLALALIFFLLVGGLIVPLQLSFRVSVATKQALPSASSSSELGLVES